MRISRKTLFLSLLVLTLLWTAKTFALDDFYPHSKGPMIVNRYSGDVAPQNSQYCKDNKVLGNYSNSNYKKTLRLDFGDYSY